MRKSIMLLQIFLLNLVAVMSQKNFVCYYGSWAAYRSGNGAFSAQDIDPNVCTHIIYSFVGIETDGSIKILDPFLDLGDNGGKGNIKKFISLKNTNPKVKLLAAIGGWNQGSAEFSAVASEAGKRKTFAQNAAAFCKKYGFDGLDMDWEYPAQREGSLASDKANFVLMLKELRTIFNQNKLLLTAAVAASDNSASLSYDILNISKYLDLINIMTYDFNTASSMKLGYNAPLIQESGTPSVEASVKYWLSKGAPKEKLILGIPLYGQTFTMSDPSHNKVGNAATGPGNPGPFTSQAGIIAYNELCKQLKSNQWTTQWDSQSEVPYTYSGNQWISYDNEKSIELKVKFAMSSQLGGAMVWSIESDDFKGNCGSGKNPLLNQIKKTLNGQ